MGYGKSTIDLECGMSATECTYNYYTVLTQSHRGKQDRGWGFGGMLYTLQRIYHLSWYDFRSLVLCIAPGPAGFICCNDMVKISGALIDDWIVSWL
jgi:hypothetical protein